MKKSAVLLLLCGAFASPPTPGPLALAAQRKIDAIQGGQSRPGSIVVFSLAELNAWARYKVPIMVPEGVRQPRLELGKGTAAAYAMVDFLKVRQGQGEETNWLIAKLIEGEKAVKVNARIESTGGRATVFLQRVEIGGLAVSGNTLDILIRTFFLPLFPNAKINTPFELVEPVDRIEVSPSEARAVMKKK